VKNALVNKSAYEKKNINNLLKIITTSGQKKRKRKKLKEKLKKKL